MLAGIFAILIAAAGAALLMLLLGKPATPGGMPGRERANRPSAAAQRTMSLTHRGEGL